MADTQGQITNGATLWRGGPLSTDPFTQIAEAVTTDPPAGMGPDIDMTHLGSAAREFKIGLRDQGTVTLTMNLVAGNASQQALEDDDGSTARYYKIIFRDAVNGRAFKAAVKQFKVDTIALDAPLRATATMRVTGAVTRLPALP